MSVKTTLTTARAAAVYREMVSVRREFCADTDFFKMPDLWEEICRYGDDWSIKKYRSRTGGDYLRRASVMIFDQKVRLNVDEQLWDNAVQGRALDNHILAHELTHLALDHPTKRGVATNFMLSAKRNVQMISAPTLIEFEADIGAVFLQCGTALENVRMDVMQLADRAFADPYLVKKARQYALLDVFQRELRRPLLSYPRVVL